MAGRDNTRQGAIVGKDCDLCLRCRIPPCSSGNRSHHPRSTEFQILVFRVSLALVGAAVAALAPGFLNIESRVYRNRIRAGGAIAVFVVIYLINPPSLIKPTPRGPENTAVVQDHQSGLTIAGIVVDQGTNHVIGQATVTLVGRAEEYVTDDSGNFRIELTSNAPKRLRLHVIKTGFQPLDLSVEPPTENLVLQLHK